MPNKQGYAVFLTYNLVARFDSALLLSCPSLNSFTLTKVPFLRHISGKLVTPSLVNKILGEVGTLVRLLPGTLYSSHSLRAGVPIAMALHADHFSPVKLLAAGNWGSNAANPYIRCHQQTSNRTSSKVYSLV